MKLLFIIIMPVKKKTKQPAFSESEEEDEKVFEQDSDKEDEQIVGYIGAADELGNFDESQFTEQDEVKQKKGQNFIHLHFQQRTSRKCLTLMQGLPEDLDFKKILRQFKKAWCCNGTIVEHEEWGTIIQLQGDKRRDIFKFLLTEGIASKEQIKIHGY